jgi:hypothetical protein
MTKSAAFVRRLSMGFSKGIKEIGLHFVFLRFNFLLLAGGGEARMMDRDQDVTTAEPF